MTATLISRKYEILFETRPQYLHVFLTGVEHTYEIAIKYWAEIVDSQNRGRHTGVLIERDFSPSLETHDVFRVLTEVAFVSRSGVKFAILDNNSKLENNEFEELVASNRGMNIKHFDSLANAERWLAA